MPEIGIIDGDAKGILGNRVGHVDQIGFSCMDKGCFSADKNLRRPIIDIEQDIAIGILMLDDGILEGEIAVYTTDAEGSRMLMGKRRVKERDIAAKLSQDGVVASTTKRDAVDGQEPGLNADKVGFVHVFQDFSLCLAVVADGKIYLLRGHFNAIIAQCKFVSIQVERHARLCIGNTHGRRRRAVFRQPEDAIFLRRVGRGEGVVKGKERGGFVEGRHIGNRGRKLLVVHVIILAGGNALAPQLVDIITVGQVIRRKLDIRGL